MAGKKTARKAAVIAAAAALSALAAAAVLAGPGLLPAPAITDQAVPGDQTSVGVGIVQDDMPAVGDSTGDRAHYVVTISDSPEVGP